MLELSVITDFDDTFSRFDMLSGYDRRQTDRKLQHVDSIARVTRTTRGRKETPRSAYYLYSTPTAPGTSGRSIPEDRCFFAIRLRGHYRLIFM